MIGYHKGNFLYITIPKNGSSTFKTLLIDDGWVEVNLLTTNLDLSTVKLWGHITNPYKRHTKGLARYLADNPNINIDDENIAKILINGMFDIHTASIAVLLGPLFYHDIVWIPLDITIDNLLGPNSFKMNGNDLTNQFFLDNGINLKVLDSDIINKVSEKEKNLRAKIEDWKKKINNDISHVDAQGNLTSIGLFYYDFLLYQDVIKQYHNRYTRY
jgi:hypothetical protein